jgi:glutathione S-transferase
MLGLPVSLIFSPTLSQVFKIVFNEHSFFLRYLTNTHTVDEHWYPHEPLQQAKVEEYLNWQHSNTR